MPKINRGINVELPTVITCPNCKAENQEKSIIFDATINESYQEFECQQCKARYFFIGRVYIVWEQTPTLDYVPSDGQSTT